MILRILRKQQQTLGSTWSSGGTRISCWAVWAWRRLVSGSRPPSRVDRTCRVAAFRSSPSYPWLISAEKLFHFILPPQAWRYIRGLDQHFGKSTRDRYSLDLIIKLYSNNIQRILMIKIFMRFQKYGILVYKWLKGLLITFFLGSILLLTNMFLREFFSCRI